MSIESTQGFMLLSKTKGTERRPLPLVAKSQEDIARKIWHFVVRTRRTPEQIPKEDDYQKPAGSSDISADAGRKSWCSGTRWANILFSRCQPGQMKPTDLMLPPLALDAQILKSLWEVSEFRSSLHEKDDVVRKSWIYWENKGVYYPDWWAFPLENICQHGL